MDELARGNDYRVLLIEDLRGPVVRCEVHGEALIDLRIGGGCDADGQIDEVRPLAGPDVDDEAIVWRGSTSLWPLVEYRLTCSPEGVRFGQCVEGSASVDRVRYLQGSTALFGSVFNPQPTSDRTTRFQPGEVARISVSSDKTYHGGNWFFTPAPLCFVLEGRSTCLAVGIAEGPGRLGFSEFATLSDEPFGVALTYDGHTHVHGEWSAPELVLLPAREPYQAVWRYCEWLRSRGLAPRGARNKPAWWREPLFCGWGEQIQQTGHAADNCTQANYERWLAHLDAHGVDPGTVVIDDKWQAGYGLNDFDGAKWPDARGFIARQHARGRKVLLWLPAWGTEGLDVAADPSTPEYATLLRSSIRHLLVDMDADGFKLDFTHRIPTGKAARTASGVWGVDLLLALVRLMHEAMHSVKPDALLIAHTANPAFADCVDMLRLNDVPGIVGQPKSYVADMEHRARIARAASPDWLIDTDNWPTPDRRSFREYLEEQPRLGVPALYFAEGIRWQSPGEPWIFEPLLEEDYAAIRHVWAEYRRRQGLPERG